MGPRPQRPGTAAGALRPPAGGVRSLSGDEVVSGGPSGPPRWRRHRFSSPAPRRPVNYRKHHEAEVWALVDAGRLSRQAAGYHLRLITDSDDTAAEVDWVTRRSLARRLGVSDRTVGRWRAECRRVGVEEHEHRSLRRRDGTFVGLANRIRFVLPADAADRVEQRLAAGRRLVRARPGKGVPTPRAPQNRPRPDPAEGAQAAARRAAAVQRARAEGRWCSEGCESGWHHCDDGSVARCAHCGGTGVDPDVLAGRDPP